MRHQKSGKKLGRTSAHRKALWSNMVCSLIEHERIQTTDTKAKELRRHAEPVIAWALSVSDLLRKEKDKRTLEERVRILHAIRMAKRVVKNRDVLHRLFDVVALRFVGRHGGYLRITKIGSRVGDAAPMSVVEFVDRGEASK